VDLTTGGRLDMARKPDTLHRVETAAPSAGHTLLALAIATIVGVGIGIGIWSLAEGDSGTTGPARTTPTPAKAHVVRAAPAPESNVEVVR
jgi:hypothetical protein